MTYIGNDPWSPNAFSPKNREIIVNRANLGLNKRFLAIVELGSSEYGAVLRSPQGLVEAEISRR